MERSDLTWRETPVPDEQAFAAMKAALKSGANFWNGGELYGTPHANSLHLLNRYFTKYPEDADKVVISIKGSVSTTKMGPDNSEKNIRRSIDECLKVLDGKKFLDLFEPARQDPNVPLEETMNAMAEYVKEGKLGGISLEVQKVAKAKGCTPAQVALAWVRSHSGRDGLGTIIPIPGSTTEARTVENGAEVGLSDEELTELEEIMQKTVVAGSRY